MADCLTFILFGQRDLYSVGSAENKLIPRILSQFDLVLL